VQTVRINMVIYYQK